MEFPDFALSDGMYGSLFRGKGIARFHAACLYVQQLPYDRISQRDALELVVEEGRGTCSSKHGLLAYLAEEHFHGTIELIAGIFLMSAETHPQLTSFFESAPCDLLPEMHCYLRYKGKRYDFTSPVDYMERIAPKLVREQRIEPHQVVDWKVKIHQEYLKAWLMRNPQLGLSFDEVWNLREEMINVLRLGGVAD